MVLASLVALAVFGLRFGIDFTGGSLLEVRFSGDLPERSVVSEKVEPIVGEVNVQQSGGDGFILRFRDVPEETHQQALVALRELGGADELRFDSVGPTIGRELKQKGVIAVGLGLLAIMFYIAYAFRKASRPVSSWQYGAITAVVALFHDVLIPLGVFAALGAAGVFEANTPFVAALLTVLGFSVHDTIVVFDRVRENTRRYLGTPFDGIVERSLRQTLVRSVNTSVTLLFAVAAVWYFGGEVIRPFALTVMVGTVLGTYSSIFIASTSLIEVERRFRRRRA